MVEAFTSHDQPERWKETVRWKNLSGETVPAFGCVQVDSYIENGDYYGIIKPTFHGTTHYFNGPVDVPANAYGESFTWSQPQAGLVDFLYYDLSQIPRQSDVIAGGGTQIGPWAGSWKMQTGGVGYRLMTGVSLDSGIATVEATGSHELYVMLDEFLEAPQLQISGAWAWGEVQFLPQDADPNSRAFYTLRDGSGSVVRRPVWSHYHKGTFPKGLLGRVTQHEGRMVYEPIFKTPIVVLKERLDAAKDRFDDDNLPSAVANYVRPRIRGNGWDIDPDSEVTMFNRGENVEYESDTLGTYDIFLGKLQFLPLDCPPEESSSSEDSESFEVESFGGPPV